MISTQRAILVFFTCLLYHTPSSAAVVFNFGNGGAQGLEVDDMATATTTVTGITATLSANSGVLNRGAEYFGINSAGTNETTSIDDDNIDEVLTITFSEAVYLNSFLTSRGSSNTSGSFTAGSLNGTFDQISGGGDVLTSFAGTGQLISIGQSFSIQQDSGAAGFSFDQITVTSVTAVPEPSLLTGLGIGLAGFAIRRRRHTASATRTLLMQ